MANIMKPQPAHRAAEQLQENESTGGVPQPAQSTAVAPFALPGKYKVKRSLTMPSLNMQSGPERKDGSIEPGAGRVLVIKTNPVVSDVVDKAGQKAAATVCDVVDGESGEVFRWLVPAVCLGNFIKTYGIDDADVKEQAAALMDGAKDIKKTMAEKNEAMRECLRIAKVDIVGKVFAVQNMGKRVKTQRYWDYNLAELEEAA